MRKGRSPAPHPDHAHRSWTHELTELAALFLTVGAAHLLANLLGHQQHGPYLLVGAGISLVTVSAAVRLGHHRRRVRRRAATAAAQLATGKVARRGTGEGSGLWRIRTTVRDDPGALARLSTVLGERGVNILGVQLYPLADGVADEFIVEAPPWLGDEALAEAVLAGHGAHPEVTRAHVRDLADLPTRALRLAIRVAADPDALVEALAELCGHCAVAVQPSAAGRGPEFDGTTLRLSDGTGRDLVVTRPMSPFTPAEYARAQVLVALARDRRAVRQPDPG